jgi:hypothetical protein
MKTILTRSRILQPHPENGFLEPPVSRNLEVHIITNQAKIGAQAVVLQAKRGGMRRQTCGNVKEKPRKGFDFFEKNDK